jgi:hypothetical protein
VCPFFLQARLSYNDIVGNILIKTLEKFYSEYTIQIFGIYNSNTRYYNLKKLRLVSFNLHECLLIGLDGNGRRN